MHILSRMKFKNAWVGFHFIVVLVLLALGSAGCKSPDYSAAMAAPSGVEANAILPRLGVGETVTVTFSGIDDPVLIPQEKPIKDDGSISLPLIGRVQAAGKTAGELEDAIHDAYVPKIYTHLTITVKTSSDRVYFVRGEVKAPGRLIYTGPITVTKAITSANDFTDYANRKVVILTRANGQRFKLNVKKILDGEAPDPPVYPGDQIEVKRRLF